MKSEKGITLTSLIIYIIALTMVVGTVSIITGNARKEIKDTKNQVSNEEYLKLTEHLTEDINSIDFSRLNVGEDRKIYSNCFFGWRIPHIQI